MDNLYIKRKIINDYKHGRSIKDISRKYKLSYSKTYRIINYYIKFERGDFN